MRKTPRSAGCPSTPPTPRCFPNSSRLYRALFGPSNPFWNISVAGNATSNASNPNHNSSTNAGWGSARAVGWGAMFVAIVLALVAA